MLVDGTVRELLARLAAPQAAPAGGSACALAAAAGASLLMMVAGLSRTRSKADVDRTALSDALSGLTDIQRELTDAIDADAVAYQRVVAALKLPKSPGAELNAHEAAVNQALRGASEVPLEIMRLSSEALELAPAIAERCHRPAASDVATAIALLRAGLEGARAAVSSNLRALGNDEFVAMARGEIVRLGTSAAVAVASAERWLTIG